MVRVSSVQLIFLASDTALDGGRYAFCAIHEVSARATAGTALSFNLQCGGINRPVCDSKPRYSKHEHAKHTLVTPLSPPGEQQNFAAVEEKTKIWKG